MQAGEDKYVIFVSGLDIGSSTSNPLKFQLLVDHITGHLGDKKVYMCILCCASLYDCSFHHWLPYRSHVNSLSACHRNKVLLPR